MNSYLAPEAARARDEDVALRKRPLRGKRALCGPRPNAEVPIWRSSRCSTRAACGAAAGLPARCSDPTP
jgi:hypothetical protein